MTTLTLECNVHFRRAGRGAPKDLRAGTAPVNVTVRPGRVPRVARLMALAIRFDEMIHTRQVKNYAELARVGRVTTARISQIMSLVVLAPDIQEEVLFLPAIQRGRASVLLCHLLPVAATGAANDGSGERCAAWFRVALDAVRFSLEHCPWVGAHGFLLSLHLYPPVS
jgi:hypothetical protein